MSWLVIACLSRLSFATCNILDAHFRINHFKNSFCQTFYFGTYLIPLLAVAYLIYPIYLLSFNHLILAAIAGFCLTVHAIPYLSALKESDTSTVVSLFTLGRVFTPLLSIIFVNEILEPREIIGFSVTLIGSLWHSYKPSSSRIDFNLLLKMLFSGLMVAGFSVSSKKLFNEVDIISGLFFIYFFDCLISLSTILIPKYSKDIIQTTKIKGLRLPYSGTVLFALLGHTLSFYAISLTKVTYVAIIGQFQAFFALVLSIAVSKLNIFRHNESLEIKDLTQKCIGFSIMGLGAYFSIFR